MATPNPTQPKPPFEFLSRVELPRYNREQRFKRARELVRRGFRVVPCDIHSRPLHSLDFWIDSVAEAETYWLRHPEAEPGILLNPGVLVVKVRVDHKWTGFDTLERRGYKLPQTLRWAGYDGTQYLLYTVPEGMKTAAPFLTSVEILGTWSLVVPYGTMPKSFAEAPAWALTPKEVGR